MSIIAWIVAVLVVCCFTHPRVIKALINHERKLLLKLTPEGKALKEKALAVPAAMGACIQMPREELLLRELLNKALFSMERS